MTPLPGRDDVSTEPGGGFNDLLPFTPVQILVLVVVALLVMWFLIKRLDKRMHNSAMSKVDGKVVGVVGRLGQGKSFFCVSMARERLERGVTVVSNFKMWLPPEWEANWRQFRGWEDLIGLTNAVVIIDEAHLLADAHAWKQFPRKAKVWLSNARKAKLDVYWITQHESRVTKALRDLTNVIYVCQKIQLPGGNILFKAKGYEPENVRKDKKHFEVRSYRLDPVVAKMYESMEIIDVDESLDEDMSSMRAFRERYNAELEQERTSAAASEARPHRSSRPGRRVDLAGLRKSS